MKRKFGVFFTAVALLFSGILTNMTGCTKEVDYVEQTKFDVSKEVWCGSDPSNPSVAFSDTGFGVVTLKQGIDGDTSHFYDTKNRVIKIRYNGIDTPESTGQVQAWGKKASKFTTSTLENAKTIVLETERGVNGTYTSVTGPEKDSTGSRYLGWVWYSDRPIEEEDGSGLRLLNLEIVQVGYSAVKSVTDKYYGNVLMDADAQAQKLKRGVWTKDPDYNYDDTNIATASLKDLYGYLDDDESLAVDCTFYFEGIVTRKLGSYDCFIEEYEYDDSGNLVGRWGIYVFTMYANGASQFFKLGRKIGFQAMVGEYSGCYQLHNMSFETNTSKIDASKDVHFVDTKSYKVEDPIVTTGAEFDSSDRLSYMGCLHQITGVTVTGGYGGTLEKDKNGDYYTSNAITLYCEDASGEFTCRIDGNTTIKYFDEDNKDNVIKTYRAFVDYCEAGATFDFIGVKGFYQYDEDSDPTNQLLLLKNSDITYHAA